MPPPLLVSQMWKAPLVESIWPELFVGVKTQLALLKVGYVLPAVRVPMVTVSVRLPLLQL